MRSINTSKMKHMKCVMRVIVRFVVVESVIVKSILVSSVIVNFILVSSVMVDLVVRDAWSSSWICSLMIWGDESEEPIV